MSHATLAREKPKEGLRDLPQPLPLESRNGVDRAETPPLAYTLQRLDALYELEANWNGYEVDAPDPDSIVQAKQWLRTMYQEVTSQGYPWLSPHVTANEDGMSALEWVKGHKSLSVFITRTDAWYVNTWGLNILTEMDEGDVNTPQERLAIWTWFLE